MSLREALELEAVACEAGDRRHAFQEFYSEWKRQDAQRRKDAGADLSKLGELDAAHVLEEIKMTRQAIDEHEAMLAEHRQAIVDGQPSKFTDANIDAIYGIIEGLRANLPAMEADLARLTAEEHRDGGGR